MNFSQLSALCIYCPQRSGELEAAMQHFMDMKVSVRFIRGFHAETFGVLGVHPYRADYPQRGIVPGYAHTGLFISHWMLWNCLSLLPGPAFLILEADAEFPQDWRTRLDVALNETPTDTDLLLVGSSNTEDKEKKNIRGSVFEVKYPFGTHAYVVYRRGLALLLDNVVDANANIDIAMITQAYPKMKVYTVLPRIVHQRNMPLMP